MAARDFLANQIKTSKIIGSGETGPKLIVYPNTPELALDDRGSIPESMLQNVDESTYLYVSGKVCGKKNNLPNSVVEFGGDVIIRGHRYNDRSEDSLWQIDPLDENNLIPTNILDGTTGLFALDLNTFSDEGTLEHIQYTMTIRETASDRYFEFDSEGNVMPIDEDMYVNACQTE